MFRCALRIEGEVYVSVDQSREEGHIAEVQHLQVSRSGGCGAVDSRNAGAVDDHKREALTQGFSVVDPGRPDCPCPPVSHLRLATGNHQLTSPPLKTAAARLPDRRWHERTPESDHRPFAAPGERFSRM